MVWSHRNQAPYRPVVFVTLCRPTGYCVLCTLYEGY